MVNITCTKCKNSLPKDNFNKRKTKSGKEAFQSWCRSCHNNHYHEVTKNNALIMQNRSKKRKLWANKNIDKDRNANLKWKYGISLEEYNLMLEKQNNLCAICQQPETKLNRLGAKYFLCVDHDHETGQVRSLLCDACNKAIGCLKDSPTLCTLAARYLSFFKKEAKNG